MREDIKDRLKSVSEALYNDDWYNAINSLAEAIRLMADEEHPSVWNLEDALSEHDWRGWIVSTRQARDEEGIIVEKTIEPHCSIEIRPEARDVYICTGKHHIGKATAINWEVIHALSDFIKTNYEQ